MTRWCGSGCGRCGSGGSGVSGTSGTSPSPSLRRAMTSAVATAPWSLVAVSAGAIRIERAWRVSQRTECGDWASTAFSCAPMSPAPPRRGTAAAALRHVGSIERSESTSGSAAAPSGTHFDSGLTGKHAVRLVADHECAPRAVGADARRVQRPGPRDELRVGRGALHGVEEVLERHLPHRRVHRHDRRLGDVVAAADRREDVAADAERHCQPGALAAVRRRLTGTGGDRLGARRGRVVRRRARRGQGDAVALDVDVEQLLQRGGARRRGVRLAHTEHHEAAERRGDRRGHLLADAEPDLLGGGEVGLPTDRRVVARRSDGDLPRAPSRPIDRNASRSPW